MRVYLLSFLFCVDTIHVFQLMKTMNVGECCDTFRT